MTDQLYTSPLASRMQRAQKFSKRRALGIRRSMLPVKMEGELFNAYRMGDVETRERMLKPKNRKLIAKFLQANFPSECGKLYSLKYCDEVAKMVFHILRKAVE